MNYNISQTLSWRYGHVIPAGERYILEPDNVCSDCIKTDIRSHLVEDFIEPSIFSPRSTLGLSEKPLGGKLRTPNHRDGHSFHIVSCLPSASDDYFGKTTDSREAHMLQQRTTALHDLLLTHTDIEQLLAGPQYWLGTSAEVL
jgi:hypothetical protein